MTLAKVAKCFVGLAIDNFIRLLPGADLPEEQLDDFPKFRFLKTLKDGHKKYDPMCDALQAVKELAETSNKWKKMADIPEDNHTDRRPDVGSSCEELEGALTAFQDGIRPLKRRRSKRKKLKKAGRSKRPGLEATKTRSLDSDYEQSDAEVAMDRHHARTAWGWLISFVEVKDDEAVSGFYFKATLDSDGKGSLLRDGDKPKAARAQFIKYFTEVMLRQHPPIITPCT